MVNYILFYVFFYLPFVFELRTIVDWTWTDTTMPIFDFIKMEFFYAKIYIVKCARVMEQNYPVPRGVPRGKVIKYMYGLPGVFGLIFLILLPLIAFSLLNQIGDHTNAQTFKMQINFEGYPPLYQMTVQGIDLNSIDNGNYRGLRGRIEDYVKGRDLSYYQASRRALLFLEDYEPRDVIVSFGFTVYAQRVVMQQASHKKQNFFFRK